LFFFLPTQCSNLGRYSRNRAPCVLPQVVSVT